MKLMIKLEEIFDIEYASRLVFLEQNLEYEGIPFISSRSTKNGCAGRVAVNSEAKLYPAGSITVPLKVLYFMPLFSLNIFT